MYPVLFELKNFTLNTYDVIWFAALALAIMWSVRRFRLYGFCSDEDDARARRVIAWAFIAMLLGARGFEYITNFRDYLDDPALLLDLNHGALSEIGAFSGAFLGALFMCRRSKISLERLCGAVALPAFLTMAVGRWGCFFSGCCVGVVTTSWAGVHFPRDAFGILRHPTQIYYSAAAVVCLVILKFIERALLERERREKISSMASARGGMITSLGLIFFTAMRFAIDPLRAVANINSTLDGFVLSHGILLACLPLELIWLTLSVKRLRRLRAASSK